MGRTGFERISQREYAKRLGLSNEAVSRAVKEGRIVKGWDKKANKIIVEHANLEWGALHMKTNITALLQQEPGETITRPQQMEQLPVYDKPNKPAAGVSNENAMTLTSTSTYAEAKRVREIIGAQMAAIDLKVKKDELVRKDEVYKQLYTFGQQMRIAILSIPDRTIDSILASKHRAEAHQLLTGELHAALESLTKVDFDFTPRDQ